MTYPVDLDAISAALTRLEWYAIHRIGSARLREMECGSLLAYEGRKALERIRVLLDAEFTGCTVAGAEDDDA